MRSVYIWSKMGDVKARIVQGFCQGLRRPLSSRNARRLTSCPSAQRRCDGGPEWRRKGCSGCPLSGHRKQQAVGLGQCELWRALPVQVTSGRRLNGAACAGAARLALKLRHAFRPETLSKP